MRVASCRTFQIPVAQAIAQVPAQTEHDDITLKMSPFEEGRRLNCHIRPGCFCVLPLTLSNRSVFCDRAQDRAAQNAIGKAERNILLEQRCEYVVGGMERTTPSVIGERHGAILSSG